MTKIQSKEKPFKLIGPFCQLLTLSNLPLKGALKDEQLEIIPEAGILTQNGLIKQIGNFKEIKDTYQQDSLSIDTIEEDLVALPGLIDAHTHICFAGSRSKDFAARNNGKSYLEIAQNGGGIWDTVTQTRLAKQPQLLKFTLNKLDILLKRGFTTVEIKSGYGLSLEHELKILSAIQVANISHPIDVISTCLAAHIPPKDLDNEEVYLQMILDELVPIIQQEELTTRFDIFIEKGAFSPSIALWFLKRLKAKSFQITVHGDQFSVGGSQVAIECNASSVDHLEASGENEILALAASNTVAVALPGASIGLGCNFTPARKLLDAGASLAIASDWNPGSAPQGNLINQASILSTFEKLSAAEVWAGMTFRAAQALGLLDRGKLTVGQLADITAFPCADYREILYHQGELQAKNVWKKGKQVS